MRNTPLLALGVILVVIGVAAFTWQNISCTTRETVVDVGPVKVMADKEHALPLSPILGGVALAGGVVLIVMSGRKT